MNDRKPPEAAPFRSIKWDDLSGDHKSAGADSKAAKPPTSGPAEEGGFRHISGPKGVPSTSPQDKTRSGGRAAPRHTPEEEARAIVEAAQREAEDIREAARREGLEAGRKQGAAELAQKTARLEKLLVDIAAFKPGLFVEAKDETLRLACAIAGRILGPLAHDNPEALLLIVERSLAMLADRSHVIIRVNAGDLQTLQDVKSDIMASIDGIKQLTFVEDPSVPPGGCMVETESTEIDARLQTQLDEVVRAVLSVS